MSKHRYIYRSLIRHKDPRVKSDFPLEIGACREAGMDLLRSTPPVSVRRSQQPDLLFRDLTVGADGGHGTVAWGNDRIAFLRYTDITETDFLFA